MILLRSLCLFALAFAFTGCGPKEKPSATSANLPTPPAARSAPNPEAQAYYKAHPNFFIFTTPADLPADLDWKDGNELPAFASPDAKRGGTQYSAIESWPPTLRVVGPDSNNSFRGFLLDDNVVSLIHRHPNADGYTPGIAKQWAVSSDRQTVYFRLDPDARWSDGVPVNADDFTFMFYFYQSPNIQAPWYNNWYSEEYTSITKFDDHTIAIKLREPKPDPLERAGLAPIPEHFYAEFGSDFPQRYQWLVEPTTGPYTLRPDGIEEGRSLTLSRISDWWANDKKFYAHRYNPDRVVFQLVRDRDKAFEMFKLGEIDAFNMLAPPRFWYDQMNIPEVEKGYIQKALFYTFEPRAALGLFLNSKKPFLDNRDVRQGIAFACNWDKVIQVVLRGDARRLHPWADSHPPFEHPTLRARPYDIDAALAAFARAGFVKRSSDGILVNDQGRRLSFTISYGSPAYADIPPVLKEEAAKAGLEFLIEKLDPTANYQKTMQKNHEIAFSGWGGGAEFAPRFWEFFAGVNAGKPQTNNLTETDIPELNELIARYDRAQNKAEMVELSHRMIELIHEDSAYVPGFVQPFIRWANWRWLKLPEWVNVREAQYYGQFGLHWIDEDTRKETFRARRDNQSFERKEILDTKWKTD